MFFTKTKTSLPTIFRGDDDKSGLPAAGFGQDAIDLIQGQVAGWIDSIAAGTEDYHVVTLMQSKRSFLRRRVELIYICFGPIQWEAAKENLFSGYPNPEYFKPNQPGLRITSEVRRRLFGASLSVTAEEFKGELR